MRNPPERAGFLRLGLYFLVTCVMISSMETNLLSPVATPTSQLSWVPEDQMYVGEVSSTRGFGRVYRDAIDEGMTLFNRTTGSQVVVVIDDVTYRDGEITSWTLVPRDRVERPFKVLLFND